MSYHVLARKWRPRVFADVAGQSHVLQALINALNTQRLHHAYLFTGTRGVGKTTLARIFAKSLNCEQGISAEPCGVCSSCREMDEGRFIDLIEVDAASRTKVEDTRELLDNVQYAPTRGRYKVYLIDEVHMLSKSSFNALLKTLEEPPPNIMFLLATTDPQKLPVTVLSRCLQFNLRRLPVDMIQGYLRQIVDKESVESDDDSLLAIARSADGSMRDALSLLDQALAFGGGSLTIASVRRMLGTIDDGTMSAILHALADHDAKALLAGVAELAERKDSFSGDFSRLLDDLLAQLHRIALAQVVPTSNDVADEQYELIREMAERMSQEDVQLYYQIGLIGRRDLSLSPDPRMGVEMALLRMLAFRPIDAGMQSSVSSGRNTDTAAPVSRPAPAAVRERTPGPTASVAREELGVYDRQPERDRAEPPADRAAQTSPVPGVPGDEWSRIIPRLGLTGLSMMVASHCVIESRNDKELVLCLESAQAHLLNPSLQQRLEERIQTYFGSPLKLVVKTGVTATETPASRQKREADERMRQAEASIMSDQGVRSLQEAFNAQVVNDSIQPVDQA
ncbi:MAG: DNA polymerase III subunit gamma/tau [Gammaproteobacteria bacterium]|nr:DNA polymerase III subunit gamma/tau [Gammaproteobacteria bacterium]